MWLRRWRGVHQGENVIVRDATMADMPALRDLYNALISTTTIAWNDQPQTLRERQDWFLAHERQSFPVLVAESSGEVIGFTAYGSFRGAGQWSGYRHTVEHTIHVGRHHWGGGIGRTLLLELIDRARLAGIHVMVGAIDSANLESICFHERLGFTEVARMPEVGRKFDRWLDLVLMQRIIDDTP